MFEQRNNKCQTVFKCSTKYFIYSFLSPQLQITIFYFFIFAFDFCRFYVVIRFFHPCHNGQWPPTSKDFYTRSYPLHYFHILILEKEPVFSFSMLSAKQGNYLVPFLWCLWYDAVLEWGLNPGPPALEASTTTRVSTRRCTHHYDNSCY